MGKVKMVQMTPDNEGVVARLNRMLDVHEHHEDCPVYHAASSTCVWPIAVCIPADVDLAYPDDENIPSWDQIIQSERKDNGKEGSD